MGIAELMQKTGQLAPPEIVQEMVNQQMAKQAANRIPSVYRAKFSATTELEHELINALAHLDRWV